MTESAGDADGLKRAVGKKPADTYDGVQFQESQRHRGIIEIHFALAELLLEVLRQRVGIYLQAEGEGRSRAYAITAAAICLAGNSFVQAQCAAPKFFIAESIEAKCLATSGDLFAGIRGDRIGGDWAGNGVAGRRRSWLLIAEPRIEKDVLRRGRGSKCERKQERE